MWGTWRLTSKATAKRSCSLCWTSWPGTCRAALLPAALLGQRHSLVMLLEERTQTLPLLEGPPLHWGGQLCRVLAADGAALVAEPGPGLLDVLVLGPRGESSSEAGCLSGTAARRCGCLRGAQQLLCEPLQVQFYAKETCVLESTTRGRMHAPDHPAEVTATTSCWNTLPCGDG
jgi:hypothetical protein